MRDWASSGRIKIDRAYKHIEDLDREISAFKELLPYFAMPDVNPNGWHGVRWTVRIVHDFDDVTISAIAADAVHNLHVALDHLWRRAIHRDRRVQRDYFPFFESPESAEARFRGKEKGTLKRAVDVLKGTDAFRVGNPFWTINCFDNSDKHDTVSLAASLLKGFQIDVGKIFAAEFEPLGIDSVIHYVTPDPFTLMKEGDVLLEIAGDVAEHYPDREIQFELAFGIDEVLEGEAVLPAIKNLAQAVDDLSDAFIDAGLLT